MDMQLLSQVIQSLQDTDRMPVLDRLRAALGSSDDETDEERRLDIVFVYTHKTFPESDAELLQMYAKWVYATFA